MRKTGRVIACLLLIALLLMTAGCGSERVDDPQLRESTQKMLDALIANDFETAYSLVSEVAGEAQFRSVYRKLQPVLDGLDAYELTANNITTQATNGVSTVSVRYVMRAGDAQFLVETTRVDGYEGLVSFYINEYAPVTTTGTLGSMQGADALQWVFLIVGLLEIAFVVVVFVDCCRHKVRKKWLWLLIIAVGYVVFSLIATPEQFRIGFDVGAFLSYTSLVRYSSGGFMARIMVPVGAVIYLCLRKSLFAKYVQHQQDKAMAEQPVLPEMPEAELPAETEAEE